MRVRQADLHRAVDVLGIELTCDPENVVFREVPLIRRLLNNLFSLPMVVESFFARLNLCSLLLFQDFTFTLCKIRCWSPTTFT